MASKKIISLGLLLMGLLAFPTFGAKMTMQQLYTDTRFQPVESFHAGCDQDVQLSFEGKEKNISNIHLIMGYNPDAIEVTRVVGTDNGILDYKIEYNQIIFDLTSPKLADASTPLFHISFKSKTGVASTDVVLDSGSYIISNKKVILLNEIIPLTFTEVPECTPDVVPPSIDLIYPKDPSAKLTLDQYFVFDVKDISKGVDLNSVKITLNGQLYTPDMQNIRRKDNYLMFYPQNRLPIGAKIDLQVSIGDKQVYGGANVSDKSYTFATASGFALQNDIDVMTFRKMVAGAKQLFASIDECVLLKNAYAKSDLSFQEGLLPVMEKLSCDTSDLDKYVAVAAANGHGAASKSLSFVSVFATLGWILFMITLVLKLHYMVAYKKHRKLSEMYKNR